MTIENLHKYKEYIVFEELMEAAGLTVQDLGNEGDERVFDLYLNARGHCPNICKSIFNYKSTNKLGKTITVEQRVNKGIEEATQESYLVYVQPDIAVWKRIYKQEEPLDITTDYVVCKPSENLPKWRAFGLTAHRFDNYWGAVLFASRVSDASKITLTTNHQVVMKEDIKEGRRVYRPYKNDLVLKHIPLHKDVYNCVLAYGFIKTLIPLKKGDLLILKEENK